MLHQLSHFFTETIWRMDIMAQPFLLRCVWRPVRFLLLTFKAYLRDGTRLHASALTYITMLAIVPVLALCLTSLKAFGAGEIVETKLTEQIDALANSFQPDKRPAPSVITSIEDTAVNPVPLSVDPVQTSKQVETQQLLATELKSLCQKFFNQINTINFAKIGVLGAVALVIMVINVLGKIEFSFNMIWGVSKQRALWRKVTDYLSVIIILPLLIVASTSLPILDTLTKVNPHAGKIADFITHLGIFNALLPLVIGTLLFAFLFGFLPNTHVKFSSACWGACVTTVTLSIFFKLCIFLQFGIATNSTLYGSLLAIPILLFWIFSSWQIILFGAELCYVHQHLKELLLENAFSHPSERDIILLALALTLRTATSVDRAHCPLSIATFAEEFHLPTRDVSHIASILERHHILVSVSDEEGFTKGYVLCRNAAHLSTADIINACLDDTQGENILKDMTTPDLLKIKQHFNTLFDTHFTFLISDLIHTKDELL